MNDLELIVEKPEVDMSIASSSQSLDVLKKAANQDGDANLTLTSFQVRKSQKAMIEDLARQTGESQATVVRAIIDEWREMKLRGCE